MLAPAAHHLAVEALQLQAPPTGEVTVERAAPPGLDGGGLGHGLLHAVVGQADAISARHRLHLFGDPPEQRACLRVGKHGSDGQPADGRDAAEGADEEELLPEDGPDVGADLRRDPGPLQGLAQPVRALALAPAQLPEHDLPRPGRLGDDARRLDRRDHVGRRAEPRRVPRRPGEAPLVVDTVLEREERRARAEERAGALRRGVGVVGLYAEQDQVHGTNLAWVVGGPHGYGERPGDPRLHGEAPRADRFQVGAAGDEGDVFPGPSQEAAEVAARPPGAYYRYAHSHTFTRPLCLMGREDPTPRTSACA